MIIHKEKLFYTVHEDFPDTNWKGEDYYLLEDNSELAQKIIRFDPNYKIVIENGTIVDVIEDEIKKIAQNTMLLKQEIVELKQKLKDTDYKAIKYAEGQLSEEEYASTKAERQSWRDRINELEAQILAQATESEATENDN